MVKTSRTFFLLYISSAAVIVLTPLTKAQSIWMNPREDRYIWLEVLAPNYIGQDRISFTSSASFLSVRYPIRNAVLKVRAVAELPFTYAKVEGTYFEYDPLTGRFIRATGTNSSLGNPYLGLEIGAPGNYEEKDAFVFGEIGFRLQVVSNEQKYSKQLGKLCDLDRLEAFDDSVTAITARFNYVDRAASGFGLRIRIGPTFFITEGADDTLYIDQAMMLTFEKSPVWAGAAFTARTRFPKKTYPTYSELTKDQIGLTVGLKLGRFQPALHYRTPLDDNLSYTLEYVYGINVGFQLP